MNRPIIINPIVYLRNNILQVKGSVHIPSDEVDLISLVSNDHLSTPLKSIWLMKKKVFKVKIVLLGIEGEKIAERILETDLFGCFYFKIPVQTEVHQVELFDLAHSPGIEFYLGNFFPIHIKDSLQIVISDFDKTLVDTTYSTLKEMYTSISSPLDYYPLINNSIEKLKNYISQSYIPFILSASPHFYEKPIRDWLYKHQVYSNNIFLKDYRQPFSFSAGELSFKDIKNQIFYKLNSLMDILLLTGSPQSLVLMGDSYESDPIVYLIIAVILVEKMDPWYVGDRLKASPHFQFNKKQEAIFLNKIYSLSELGRNSSINIQIFIRLYKKKLEDHIFNDFDMKFLIPYQKYIEYYSD